MLICPLIADSSDPDLSMFHLYREDSKEYVMSAVMMPNSNNIAFFRTSSVTPETVYRRLYDEDYLGVMKGNDLGTEFLLYDNGVNPALLPECIFEDNVRNRILRITYKHNFSGREPNSMQLHVPATVVLCSPTDVQRREDRALYESMLATVPHEKRMTGFKNPEILVTRKPVWSEELGGWTLVRLGC